MTFSSNDLRNVASRQGLRLVFSEGRVEEGAEDHGQMIGRNREMVLEDRDDR